MKVEGCGARVEWISKPVFRAMVTIAIVAIIFLLVWYAIGVLLVVFGGMLLAIFFRGLADLLSEHTRLGRRWSLLIVILGVFAALVAAGYFLFPSIAAQVDIMMKILPGTIRHWIDYLNHYDWGRWILSEAPRVETALLTKMNIPHLVSNAIDALVAAGVIIFIGIYMSAQSGIYFRGLIKLFPEDRRDAARRLLDEIGSTMRWWMVGRATAMLSVGIMNWIGLSLIGIPLAKTLALIAALLTFIPYIGSAIAVIPTMLVALTISPGLVFGGVIVHFIAQSVEAYFVTPIAQRRAVELAPAVTITAQFLMGAWAGIVGLLFATPLAAIGLVLVNELYLNRRPQF